MVDGMMLLLLVVLVQPRRACHAAVRMRVLLFVDCLALLMMMLMFKSRGRRSGRASRGRRSSRVTGSVVIVVKSVGPELVGSRVTCNAPCCCCC
jgi:hypothetical protein